jgi:hypothetical protein
MTLAETIKLVNCSKGRGVLLYIENDTRVQRGEAVNDIQEFPCDDRADDLNKPDSKISPGYAQYEIEVYPEKLCPRCTVSNCIHHNT